MEITLNPCFDAHLPIQARERSTERVTSDEQLLQDGYRYALSLSSRHHDAQDLVQQAALRLFRKYGELKNRGVVFTTVRNLFYDQKRREKIVPIDSLDELEHKDDESPRELAVHSDPDHHSTSDLEVMLEQLAPNEREVIVLHYLFGHTAREIGELTNRPRNTILSMLSRTRQKLESFAKDPERGKTA